MEEMRHRNGGNVAIGNPTNRGKWTPKYIPQQNSISVIRKKDDSWIRAKSTPGSSSSGSSSSGSSSSGSSSSGSSSSESSSSGSSYPQNFDMSQNDSDSDSEKSSGKSSPQNFDMAQYDSDSDSETSSGNSSSGSSSPQNRKIERSPKYSDTKGSVESDLSNSNSSPENVKYSERTKHAHSSTLKRRPFVLAFAALVSSLRGGNYLKEKHSDIQYKIHKEHEATQLDVALKTSNRDRWQSEVDYKKSEQERLEEQNKNLSKYFLPKKETLTMADYQLKENEKKLDEARRELKENEKQLELAMIKEEKTKEKKAKSISPLYTLLGYS
jgi:hypothetical protein